MSVCDIPVIAEVCGTVGEGTASLITAPFDWLAHAMGSAAAWLFEAVWDAFDTTTLVDLTDPGYIAVFNVLFGVAVLLALIFFCLQLITGLVRRDPGALSRAALGLAKAVLGSFVIVTITGLLLEITDQLTIGIVQASGNTMEGMGDRIALLASGLAAINIGAPGVGAIVTIFLSALAISAAAIVWFSLLIRQGAAARRDRLRSGCARWRDLGCREGVVLEVGGLRDRADPVEARAGRDLPGRGRAGVGADRCGSGIHQRSDRRDRTDVHRRIRAVHHVQVPQLRRPGHVSRDVE